MNISAFKNNISSYAGHYSPAALFGKLREISGKAGRKLVYMVLILYYATLDKDMPVKDRAMILAALGYFILPVDFLPDAFLMGFSDDMAALVYVLKKIWGNLTPATIQKAKNKLQEWFGDESGVDYDLPVAGVEPGDV